VAISRFLPGSYAQPSYPAKPQLPGKQLPGERSKTETGPGGPRGRWWGTHALAGPVLSEPAPVRAPWPAL
jgi:hypothetical protein